MWLRDSTNQVWPYLRFLRNDTALKTLVAGVIHRQAANVLRNPYANAFQIDDSRPGEHATDSPIPAGAITNWVFEYKWELDSLANVLRLSSGYFNATGGDAAPFDAALGPERRRSFRFRPVMKPIGAGGRRGAGFTFVASGARRRF